MSSEATTDQPSITCPRCGMTSYHPSDISQLYCGRCHWWTSDPVLGPHYDEIAARAVSTVVKR